MKRNLAVIFSLLSLTIGGVCGALKEPVREPYKVGAVFSLSGIGALLGAPEEKTVKMLQEQINAQGGIGGHPLQLIVYDDESDAEKCAALVKRLIEEEDVVAVIGPSLSDTSIAAAPIAEAGRTPLISCAASYKIVTSNRNTGEQYRWIFKTAQSDSLAVEAIYTHLKKRGINRVAVLTADSGFGRSGREELLRLAPAFGIDVVAAERFGPRATSMMSQLNKIKKLDHGAIINWSIGPTQIIVLHNWRDLGMSVTPLYQSHGFGNPRNIALAGTRGEGVYCPLGACNIAPILPDDHPQKRVAMAYWNDYTGKYGEPVSSFGGHAWDALMLLVDALKTVGPEKEAIREHLEFRKAFVGQHGVFNFSPVDHNGLSGDAFIMVVVRDGQWSICD